MRERFEVKNFQKKTELVIAQAIDIITEYHEQGYQLTLRQLYYQFVARDLMANKQRNYNRLGRIVSDARLAGLIDWSAIVDRTRNVRRLPQWNSGADGIKAMHEQFTLSKWDDQPYYVEVWIEKDALIGVIESVCNEYEIRYMACRGYMSQSEQYAAGKRFEHARGQGKEVVLLHLGDHDASGIDMTRDNSDRVNMFSCWSDVDVRRLALNMDQVEQYDPPPNPAKETDSRSDQYIALYGSASWELDALEPSVINSLIDAELEQLIDWDAFNAARDKESTIKARFKDFIQTLEKEDL